MFLRTSLIIMVIIIKGIKNIIERSYLGKLKTLIDQKGRVGKNIPKWLINTGN